MYGNAIRDLLSIGTYANVVSLGVSGSKGPLFHGYLVGSKRIDHLTYDLETKLWFVIRSGGDQDHISKYIPVRI